MKDNPKFKNLSLICLVFLFALLEVSCFSNQSAHPNKLTSGKLVTNRVVNDEIHTYVVSLEANQYLALKIEQNDVDVIAEVFSPSGESLGEFDTPTSARGTETVRIGAVLSGTYKIDIFTLSENAEPGTYTLKIVENRPLTHNDSKILSAVEFQQQADKLRAEAETRAESILLYEKALEIWRETGEKADEGNTLRAMGFAYQRMDKLEKAKEHFGKALEIWNEIGDQRSAAFTYIILGVIAKKQDDLQKGLEFDLQAQPLWTQADDKREFTQNLARIGGDYVKLENKEKALEYYEQALENSRKIESKTLLAYVLGSYGDAQVAFDNKTEAAVLYQQSFDLWKSAGREKVAASVQEKIDKLGK